MKPQKAIIFDASTLISFSMTGLTEQLRELRKIFNGKFLITQQVKKEIIDKPITIKKFELEALRLKQLLDEKTLEMPSSLNISDNEINKKTNEILNIANSTFSGGKKEVQLMHLGEASCLALSKTLSEKGIQNVLAIDERTARMLVERPKNLEKLFQKKLHVRIKPKIKNYKFFEGFKIIRSTELIYVAYKKGLVELKDGIVLDALLYALKFKGCAISGDEIKEIKKLA